MNNTDFILNPISHYFERAVQSLNGLNGLTPSFDIIGVFDYVLQSAFLQTTGCLEQKVKTIAWEMATNDYEYRYEFTQTPLGECSSFANKNKTFKKLNSQIIKRMSTGQIVIHQEQALKIAKTEITSVLEHPTVDSIKPRQKRELEGLKCSSKVYYADNKNGLLGGDSVLTGIYNDCIYKLRNRLAHNSLANVSSLPTIKELFENKYNDSLFVYFAVLFVIDSAFIELFKAYKATVYE